jgi:putative transcriptional regulator
VLRRCDLDAIQGTGGVRKLRREFEGLPLFALTAYAKNERADLSQKDRNDFRRLTKLLAETYWKDDEMSKVADSIRRGLEEAVAYARGEAKESAYRVHVPALIDVRAIRTKLGMTQEEFAGRFGFSVNTLRHWEQGKRQPEGPTRAYLLVIERAPKAVQKALHAA